MITLFIIKWLFHNCVLIFLVDLFTFTVGLSWFRSGAGGEVHDVFVSSMAADPLTKPAEKRCLVLECGQTAAISPLLRWSETRTESPASFFLFKHLLTVVHDRHCVVGGGAASVSSERVWEFGTDWARPGGAVRQRSWSTEITGTNTAAEASHYHPLGRPTGLC